jgi:DNA-binding NtrC family response regulator
VGGHREIPIDARIIAATGTSLDEAVAAGAFRADLLYRLDVIRFVLPPLRERPEDIVFLFGHFLRKAATHHRLHRPEVTDDFLDALQAFEWRGNVRQLENLAERLLLTHPQGRLTARHFRRLAAPLDAPPLLPAPTASAPLPAAAPPDLGRTLPESIAAATALHERAYLEAMLRECRGRIGDTARRAGIHRRTLLRRMIALGLDKRAFRPLPNATIEPSSG